MVSGILLVTALLEIASVTLAAESLKIVSAMLGVASLEIAWGVSGTLSGRRWLHLGNQCMPMLQFRYQFTH